MQLIINAGSSTLKWALYDNEQRILEGSFDRFGDKCIFSFAQRKESIGVRDHTEAVEFLLQFLGHNEILSTPITSCVHRVVHGGEKYTKPTTIDNAVLEDIAAYSTLAPLHNPANLAGIKACMHILAHAKQVAIFDTAFHSTIAKYVFLYGIPTELYNKHKIRKYGFHGISHAYIARLLAQRYGAPVDAISCHLGSGSSITALRQGLSADTTMGFTPLDGVLMGTRSGELDAEVPLFLLKNEHYSVEDLEDLLTKKSGLLGITGHSDVRDIWQLAQQGDQACKLGLDMLSYRIAYFINGMRTAVANPKAIVFTAGIGERAWYIRQVVCQILGIPLDMQANKENKEKISAQNSPVDVLVLHTDEQEMMHHLAKNILG